MNRRNLLKNVGLILGGTLSAPTLMAMSRRETKNFVTDSDFKLTERQRQIVAEVAETILPKTNTPGAKDAGVPAFIEMMLQDCYSQPECNSFLSGVKDLEAADFLNMDTVQRTKALKKIQAESKKLSYGSTSFWRLMKELTLLGYYTSEVGIKASFEYVPIPGKLENIKIKPNQKSYVY